jgi:hypothetical protein
MPVIDQSVVIARPAAEVFEFLVCAENLPRWDSSMLGVRPGRVRPGHGGHALPRRQQDSRPPHRVDHRGHRLRAGRSVEEQDHRGDAEVHRLLLSKTPEGTNVCYRLVADSGSDGAFGRAMEPIVEKARTKVVKGNLDTLVGLLEQQAA